jgi:hypothetical protein
LSGLQPPGSDLPPVPAPGAFRHCSPNFTLYSTHTEDDARRTLETFEQTRDFFHQVNAFEVTSQLPFTLVDFGGESEYRPFTPGPFVRAWLTGNDDADYIVMSHAEGEAKRVAVHEYAYSVVRHSGLRLPLWLNEGLAEVNGNSVVLSIRDNPWPPASSVRDGATDRLLEKSPSQKTKARNAHTHKGHAGGLRNFPTPAGSQIDDRVVGKRHARDARVIEEQVIATDNDGDGVELTASIRDRARQQARREGDVKTIKRN